MNNLTFAIYTATALAWSTVFLVYGKAAWDSYIEEQFDAPRVTIVQALVWFFTQLGEDVLAIFRTRPARKLPYTPYSPGHMLRFWIGLGSVHLSVMPLLTVFVDRTQWDLTQYTIVMTSMAMSCVVAFGHLAIAWKYGRKWRWFVVSLTSWWFVALLLIAPLFALA
jgi:hypothetical protein